jgi:hypothetical protein
VPDRAQVSDDPAATVVAEYGHPIAAHDARAPEPGPKAAHGRGDLALRERPTAIGLADEDRLGDALGPVKQ